jgi:hypothetical protein
MGPAFAFNDAVAVAGEMKQSYVKDQGTLNASS